MVCLHGSARNMCIMWMNQVQISPFFYDLLAQQRFKVTLVDFGTAPDSRDVHISSRYVAQSRKDLKYSNSVFCVPAVNQPHWSCSARHCQLSAGCFKSKQHSKTNGKRGIWPVSLSRPCVFVLLFLSHPTSLECKRDGCVLKYNLQILTSRVF